MKCSQVQRSFDELYRGDCGPATDKYRAHITACASCGRAFRQWQLMAGILLNAPSCAPPKEFTQKVLAAVEGRDPAAGSKKPVIIPFPLARRLALAALLVLAFAGLFSLRQVNPKPKVSPVKVAAVENTVRFTFADSRAITVAVVGDFNGWDPAKNQLAKSSGNTWEIDLPIGTGSYQYLFLVNGTEWKIDPASDMQVPDGFGGFNSEINL